MNRETRILFITSELPYPAHSGGKLKSFKFLESLAERCHVSLACPLKLEDEIHLVEFRRVTSCKEILCDKLHVARNAINLLASYLRGFPLNVHRTFSKGLKDEIGQIIATFDMVVLDHYEGFAYLPRKFDGVTIYHSHNAYFKMWERYAATPGNPFFRLAAGLEALRVRRYESHVARQCDLVFAAPNDAEELVKNGVVSTSIRPTFHLGDDNHLNRPDLAFDQSRKTLMYVGYLGWEPNAQGLLWFIEHVWPRLIAHDPDIEFDIVGKNADERLTQAVACHPGIRLRGFVDDLDNVYRESSVSVAPLLCGSGMKVKVMDAMARGMPVVTTPVGAEGIDVEHASHLMIAKDPDEMAKNILRLLSDPELWHRIRDRSRELMRTRYTWKKLISSMHADMSKTLHDKSKYQTCNPGSAQHAL